MHIFVISVVVRSLLLVEIIIVKCLPLHIKGVQNLEIEISIHFQLLLSIGG